MMEPNDWFENKIKNVILNQMHEDNSPFYRPCLYFLRNDGKSGATLLISQDTEDFVFMKKSPKDLLLHSLEIIMEQIDQEGLELIAFAYSFHEPVFSEENIQESILHFHLLLPFKSGVVKCEKIKIRNKITNNKDNIDLIDIDEPKPDKWIDNPHLKCFFMNPLCK